MRLRDQAGFSVIEVMIAAAVLGIGIIAVLAGTTIGFTGVDAGRRSSTALFLAEARLEQARAFSVSATPGQGFAALVTGALADEPYTTIPGYAGYRRTVTVNAATGVPNTKFVQVAVFYRPASQAGLGPETAVTVSTLLAEH